MLDELGFDDWKRKIDDAMTTTYCLCVMDAGIESEQLLFHWRNGDTPENFVDWFARKYDLISKSDVGIASLKTSP